MKESGDLEAMLPKAQSLDDRYSYIIESHVMLISQFVRYTVTRTQKPMAGAHPW